MKEPKRLKFKWTATDANEDELTYSVYVRKDTWKSWVLLDDDLDKTEFEWDTTTTPSGTSPAAPGRQTRTSRGRPSASALEASRTTAG